VRARALLSQILVVAVAVAATAVVIQVQPTAESAPAPVIAAAQPNSEAQTLTIQGVNFGDAVSEVTLGLSPLAVSSWTSNAVVTELPAYQPGSYLLVLKRADGIFSNSMDLTIGAVGPVGPAGPQGPVARATDTLMGFGGGEGLGSGLGAGDARDEATTRAIEDANNTAYGINALRSLAPTPGTPDGTGNAAFGKAALRDLTTGYGNLSFGSGSMQLSTTALNNVAIGNAALRMATGNENVAVGSNALRDNLGSRNLAFGFFGGNNNKTGSNNIYFSNLGVDGESGVIRLGASGVHNTVYVSGTIHGDGSGLTGVTAVYQ